MAERIGRLTNRLAVAESQLRDLSVRVELMREAANKARVDLRRAERAHQQARQAAASTSAQAEAAARRVDHHRRRLDAFVASSYRQGSRLGSIPSFVGAETPREMLDRATLLDVISDTQLDVLDDLRRARARKANKDSLARQAVQRTESTREAAERARTAAEAARRAALTTQAAQQARADELRSQKAGIEHELARARTSIEGLQAQRERYQDWLAAKDRQEQAAAAALTQNAPQAGTSAPGPSPETADPAGSSDSVETVVQRALSQLGVTYAWGGGDAHGPSKGIRDGGVADAHGDYRKIGFDCSGLMVYAFAGVGIDLPHYSGYQYQAGKRVPLSQMRRGDMLFWQDGGSTHHVALYLGNGQMVEAPYSGAQVRVTSVRYDGIAPHAVRML